MKPITFVRLFIFLSIIIWDAVSIYSKIPGKESDALRILFNDTGGSDWRNKQNWKGAPGTEHTWYGITCNPDKTTVLEIKLPNNNLQGKLPADLGALANLTTLDLSNNQLIGTIPLWIEKLKHLKKLDLSHNRFTGPIPAWIGNLKNLEELLLDDNMLEGPIPGALGRLSKLKVLSLGSNLLNGEIPAALGILNQLVNNRSNFKWNALYTQDAGLKRFLNRKQIGADWESTQTTAPLAGDIKVVEFTEDAITIEWKPVKYTADTGGYRVFYRQEGKPYDDQTVETTTDKTVTRVTLKELEKSTKYYFKIRTWTGKHSKNRNSIESKFSKEFSATTRGIIISGIVTNYLDLEQRQTGPFQGVQIKASHEGGTAVTKKDGKYSLNVNPGWTGTITPAKEGFDFSPPERTYPPVGADISGQDYTAAANTVISGKVTYKGEGLAGVELTFSSREGKAALVKTVKNGSYQHIVAYNWSGTVTPKKAGHGFEPPKREYTAVISHLQGQDYKVLFRGISGRVTGRSGKTGISGVALTFSGIDKKTFPYLKEYDVTDANGNYWNDIPDNWSGSVTPKAPKKQKYIFYPAVRDNLTGEDAKRTVDFRAERDFNFYISGTANYRISSESVFKEVYGSGIMDLEIMAGWKFNRNYYIWGGYGLFSKSGKSRVLEDPARWRQKYLSLGLGYYDHLSIRFGWTARMGARYVRYGEEGLGEDVSYSAFGVRVESAGIYKINDRLFTEISIGYLFASDTIEEISIKLGGFRAGVGLGLRF